MFRWFLLLAYYYVIEKLFDITFAGLFVEVYVSKLAAKFRRQNDI